MNVCFYFVYHFKDMTHIVDAVGLAAFAVVVFTFVKGHVKSGLWKLTHAGSDKLDERELLVTHNALGYSYGLFTALALALMMANAVLFDFVPEITFVLTVPLVGSLIYLAHTLPGSYLAWTETEVPGESS